MNDLANIGTTIPAMSQGEVQLVRNLESELSKLDQHDYPTQHAFHAGMYARTVCVPAGHVITGALIEIPTMLVISGDVTVNVGTQPIRITGYNVMMAEAGRKQAFYAHEDTYITMLFPTKATTVDEAEREFTKEYEMLLTRRVKL